MEVLYGKDDGSIQAASQGLLGATLVCDEGFEHGPHHVQLEKERKRRRSGAGPPSRGKVAGAEYIYFLFLLLKTTVLRKYQFRWRSEFGTIKAFFSSFFLSLLC